MSQYGAVLDWVWQGKERYTAVQLACDSQQSLTGILAVHVVLC